MKRNTLRFAFALSLLVAALCAPLHPATAEVTLPHVIGENMVLQRGIEAPIWGWAEPGEEVKVAFGGVEASAVADAGGKWMVKLPPLDVGEPRELHISGAEPIVLANILVGDVWVCSGQSNMEMGVGECADAENEIKAADYPKIRLLRVERKAAPKPQRDCEGAWQVCNPDTLGEGGWGGFSAAAYYFGREIHRETGVPIGLIQSAWGGTRIEPWTPPAGFDQVPALEDIAKEVAEAGGIYQEQLAVSLGEMKAWIEAAEQALAAGNPIPDAPSFPRHPLAMHGGGPVEPTSLYNAMVHPLVPFALRGAIWYQGESNMGDALYGEKMKALVGGWRSVWNQGEFPFYYVQIAPFAHYGEGQLPRFWEMQTAAMAIPSTGMAATTDISMLGDIHPKNKRDVGKRLALWALAKDYGKSGVVYSSPRYKAMAIEDGKVRISFDHVGSGLVSRDGKPLDWFTIAGEDKEFAEAQAEIDGDTVLVSSDAVASPVAVRFGWHKEAEPNLSNKEGLPALPFRTDTW